MNQEEFEQVFEREVERSRNMLVQKAKEYASDSDRLHNFKMAAVFTKTTPEKALWGFLTKHLVSVTDMVTSEKSYPEEVWDEKIGDVINYFILLRAQVFESEKVQDNDAFPEAPTVVFTQNVYNPAPSSIDHA